MLCLVMVLLHETAFVETVVDKTKIVIQVVIWVMYGMLSKLGVLDTWMVKTYILPWLLTNTVR